MHPSIHEEEEEEGNSMYHHGVEVHHEVREVSSSLSLVQGLEEIDSRLNLVLL